MGKEAQEGCAVWQVWSQVLRVEKAVWEEVDSEGLAGGKARQGVMPARRVSRTVVVVRVVGLNPGWDTDRMLGRGGGRVRSGVARRDQV